MVERETAKQKDEVRYGEDDQEDDGRGSRVLGDVRYGYGRTQGRQWASHGPRPRSQADGLQQAPKAAQKAPVAAHAPSHSYGVAGKQNNRPTRQVARHTAPQPAAHHAPAPMQVTHHKPARRPETPCHRHHRHECNDCHYNDNGWIGVGAGIIGGIIGALIAG